MASATPGWHPLKILNTARLSPAASRHLLNTTSSWTVWNLSTTPRKSSQSSASCQTFQNPFCQFLRTFRIFSNCRTAELSRVARTFQIGLECSRALQNLHCGTFIRYPAIAGAPTCPTLAGNLYAPWSVLLFNHNFRTFQNLRNLKKFPDPNSRSFRAYTSPPQKRQGRDPKNYLPKTI